MICYKDKTFCASKTEHHTCGLEFTEQDAVNAEKWWGGKDYPVAFGKFCEEDKKKINNPLTYIPMKQLNSHNFKEVYQWLGIDLNKLGCLMLDTESIVLPTYIIQDINDGSGCNFDKLFESYCYKAKNKDRFWIDGFVGSKPHMTLLYGFLTEANTIKPHIEAVLSGWDMKSVKISDIGFFDSPYKDEPYYCIVAHIEVSDLLLEGHNRLEFLPHVNTFTGYKPHVTIGYIEKRENVRDYFIQLLKKELVGKELKITGLNYGGNK